MLNGLRTATYTAEDLGKARSWYASLLGKKPYFEAPSYVGFNVGGYELGLMPDEENAGNEDGSVTVYWGVDDIEKAMADLQKAGAKPHGDVEDVGEGIRMATVRDPFGNVLGVIENPNFEVE